MQDVYTVSQGWSNFTLKAKLRRQQAGPQGQTQDAILQSCFMWETEGIQIIFWGHLQSHVPTSHVTIVHLSFRPLRAVNWKKPCWLAAPIRGTSRITPSWHRCARWGATEGLEFGLFVGHLRTMETACSKSLSGPCHFWGAGQFVCYVQGQTIDLLILEGIPPEQRKRTGSTSSAKCQLLLATEVTCAAKPKSMIFTPSRPGHQRCEEQLA